MKKLFLYFSTIVCLFILASGCSKVVTPPEPVEPLYQTLAAYDSHPAEWRDSVLRADSSTLAVMFEYLGKGSKVTDSLLADWSRSRAVEVFTPAVDSVFHSLKPLENELGEILYNARRNGFDLPRRSYAAVVWGNRRSIVMTDSLMLIALNHYLGADYPGYASMPEYMRQSKSPERLQFDIAEALLESRYPFSADANTTVLSRMLYEGAVLYCKIKLTPNADVAQVMGYSDSQLHWLTNNTQAMWNALVAGKMLYSTSTLTADQLLNPAPGTPLLGAGAPPRAGRFIGYAIVTQYMLANQATKLPTLLSPQFYNDPSILLESAYE